MAIRLLNAILFENDNNNSNSSKEPAARSQKFALIKAYSSEIVEHFLAVLTKICGYHEQPHLHTATFAGQNGKHNMLKFEKYLKLCFNRLHALVRDPTDCQDPEAVAGLRH